MNERSIDTGFYTIIFIGFAKEGHWEKYLFHPTNNAAASVA
jgi:hypothetical protein